MFLLAVNPFDITGLVGYSDTKEIFEIFIDIQQKKRQEIRTKPAKNT